MFRGLRAFSRGAGLTQRRIFSTIRTFRHENQLLGQTRSFTSYGMDQDHAGKVADEFLENGVAKIGLRASDDFVKDARILCTRVFEEGIDAAKRASVDGTFPVGMEHGFAEIVHRAQGRYDCLYGINGHPSMNDVANLWIPLINEVLGGLDNWELQFNGMLMTLPGAAEQLWHVDGEHLFWEQPNLAHSPPHCVNILLPLVDMSPGNGGTEFCLASQKLTSGTDEIVWQDSEWKNRINFKQDPYAITAKAGEMFAFDYRVLHRAVSNRTQNPRPVLYWTYVRRWFRDGLNFPKRSVLDTIEHDFGKTEDQVEGELALNVRNKFPALIDTTYGKRVFADGAAETQVPESVAEAVKSHLLKRNANVGGAYRTSEEALECVTKAREAAAELLGCDRRGVTFGNNCTNIMFHLARSITRILSPGDNIILSEACHDANIAPWLLMARDSGVEVRWLQINKDDASLDVSDEALENLIDSNTKLVAIGIASNATGNNHTPACRKVITEAKKVGAYTIIDGTQYVAHYRTNFKKLDADAFVCSPYKFFGPHMGLMAAKPSFLSEVLTPYKVGWRADGDQLVADLPTPEGYEISPWEMGTLAYESLAGLEATVEYLKSISPHNCLDESFRIIVESERNITKKFLKGLKNINNPVHLFGTHDETKRTPTFAMLHENRDLVGDLNRGGVYCTHGNHYAVQLVNHALGQKEGVTRVSLMHYNTLEEVDHILNIIDGC